MKKLLIFILFFTSCLIFHTPPANAHVLETNSTVGAVMHIDPEDNPIVGEQSTLYFDLKDTSGEFTSANCNCQVSIVQNKKTIFVEPLFQNTTDPNSLQANVSFVFPEKGVYDIIVDGKPLQDDTFHPFHISFTVRVSKDTPNPTNTSTHNNITGSIPNLNLPLVSGFLLILIAFLLLKHKKRNEKK